VIIFVKLGIDLFLSFDKREGMDLEMPVLNIKLCDYKVNLVFPYYDVDRKVYTDKNNFIYNNYQNILLYADPAADCHP
jgi:5-methylthioribose kinase